MKFIPISKQNYSEVSKIYEDGIDTGLATFETEIPDWNTWNNAHLPFARIALTNEKNILGWAALKSVSKRSVYKGIAEISIYVATNESRKGIGTKLLKSLIEISEAHGIWTLQASIMDENKASIQMHLNCGFRVIGFREKIGKLNGNWLNNTLLERRSKIIGI